MFRRILVAFDGSDGAKRALAEAIELAVAGGTEFHVLAVGRIPEYAQTVSEVEEAREQARRYFAPIIEAAEGELQRRGVTGKTHLDFGKPSDVVLRRAEELGANLIVLGTNPHSALRRRILGATVDKIVDHAHCSVLVVRDEA